MSDTSVILTAKASRLNAYRAYRHYYSCELLRLRAMVRVGNTTEPSARKERTVIIREFARLRASRS
jgi:hypothetical protein